MRKLALFGASALLLFGLAGTASAAGQTKPIQVLLNGEPLQFANPPVSLSGSTYVEFRSLFTQLGYSIQYEAKTKTIKAKSAEHELQMSVGGDVAFVDGQTVPANGQLKSVNGRTLVGVRFIAALSGKNVNWDAATSTVQIADKGPSAEEAAAVLSLFDKIPALEASPKKADYLTLFSPDSPLRPYFEEDVAKSPDKETLTSTTFLGKEVVEYSKQEATVATKEHTVRVSGDFYFDNVSDMLYTLRPNASGQWLIYDMEQLAIEYDKPEALLDKAVSVPEAEKTAIEALLKAQNDAYNAEDTEAFRKTVVAFEGLDETVQSLKDIFAEMNLRYTIEKTAIVSYSEDRAIVVQSKVAEEKEAGVKLRLIQGNELVKKDGKWLFGEDEYVLKQEDL